MFAEKCFLSNYDVCRTHQFVELSIFFAEVGRLPKNYLPKVSLYIAILADLCFCRSFSLDRFSRKNPRC